MARQVWRVLLFAGLLLAAFGPSETSAQSMKKRGTTTVDLDGYKSAIFDYWKSDKDKVEKPVLSKFTITDKKDTAEILVKELGTGDTARSVFDEIKKQTKAPEGRKLEELITESEVKKDGPKITQMAIRIGNFTEGKKEQKDVKIVASVVETKDKRYLVRLIGPRILISTVEPDMTKFLQDFKK